MCLTNIKHSLSLALTLKHEILNTYMLTCIMHEGANKYVASNGCVCGYVKCYCFDSSFCR